MVLYDGSIRREEESKQISQTKIKHDVFPGESYVTAMDVFPGESYVTAMDIISANKNFTGKNQAICFLANCKRFVVNILIL